MAQKVNIILVDDLTGEEGADETVAFALDGKQYEIDLTAKNATKLRKAMEQFIDKGRTVGGRRAYGTGTAARSSGTNGTRRSGTRRRTATIEQVEASKSVGSPA